MPGNSFVAHLYVAQAQRDSVVGIVDNAAVAATEATKAADCFINNKGVRRWVDKRASFVIDIIHLPRQMLQICKGAGPHSGIL